MKKFKQPVATEDRIFRATLPYWWPTIIMVASVLFAKMIQYAF